MSIETIAPILDSTQPAFDVGRYQNLYPIYFKLNNVTNLLSAKTKVQLTVRKQSNNQSVLKEEIKYYSINNANDYGYYSINILSSDFAKGEGWKAGVLYKIQVRFAEPKIYKTTIDKDTKKEVVTDEVAEWNYSEWSNVMVVKGINAPNIQIINASGLSAATTVIKAVETDNLPLFIGKCEFDEESKEYVDKYRFILYAFDKEQQKTIELERSNWIQHNASDQSFDNYRFKTFLKNDETSYTVVYEIISNNGYTAKSKEYNFNIVLNQLASIVNECELDIESINREKGCIGLKLQRYIATKISDKETTIKTMQIGNYVLMRSDEDSNFELWEDLQFYYNDGENILTEDVYFQDYTVESGKKYKYSIVFQNKYGVRSQRAMMKTENGVSIDLEYVYLYRNGVQLDLKYNVELSSFKNTTLMNKSDTLGSKYPTISRNGMAYYTEFPITGLISFQMDSVQDFFTWKDDGYYYNNELIIPKDKFHSDKTIRNHCNAIAPDSTKTNTIKTVSSNNNSAGVINSDLTEDNTFIERKFREKVEEFLNDGKPKLFRSSTEGNKVVVLMGVSLSPQNTLGRMIYNFSATAYEVIENTLDNLNDYGIISIGEFQPYDKDNNTKLVVGQIVINPNEFKKLTINEQNRVGKYNLYNWVTIKAEKMIPAVDSDNYSFELKTIDSFWFDYSKDFNKNESNRVISFKLNGQNLYIMPHRIFAINNQDMIISALETTQEDIIFNYTCTLTKKEKKNTITIGTESYTGYQQLAGIFTNDKEFIAEKRILNGYFDNEVELYKIPSNPNDIYTTLNLEELILYFAQEHIKTIYELNNLVHYIGENEQDSYYYGTDGAGRLIECKLNVINSVVIEAEPGTKVILNKGYKEEMAIYIGDTGKYIIKPSVDLIYGIEFAKTTYAIIDFTFTSVQTIKE